MSEENVELCHRAADALNRRDLDAFLALLDPDVEFNSRIAELEGGGPFRGHGGVSRWWEDLFDVFPDFSAKVEGVQDLGDVTVTRVRQHSQGVESDAPADQTQWIVTEWRHKKGIWWRIFLNEAEALKAAELRE
jgi:ketosteroid isomerase-like protein